MDPFVSEILRIGQLVLIYLGHSYPLTRNHAKSILFKNVMRDFLLPDRPFFTA
ncbi:unnamed protein product [marine sediment metagenome]|uniref:Uncharacterized protein n=1 Tax=marine sediment metagenome TaxID=412755 RepID=X0SZI5_9ZZZZ